MSFTYSALTVRNSFAETGMAANDHKIVILPVCGWGHSGKEKSGEKDFYYSYCLYRIVRIAVSGRSSIVQGR